MHPESAHELCCPFCLDSIKVTQRVSESPAGIEYGLLECPGCRFEFPIVAGVTLLFGPDDAVDVKAETDARTVLGGPRIRDLVRTLKAGDVTQALSLLLSPTGDEGRLFPSLSQRHERDELVRRENWHDGVRNSDIPATHGGRFVGRARRRIRRMLLPRARRRLAEFLTSQADNLAALDVVRLYYGAYSGTENFNYFAFRFGQPRHLAALGVASLFHRTDGPILDLACGMGHLTHYFSSAFPGRPVFAVDRDFVRLLIARRYVAPHATYLCAAADQALPFRPGYFGAVFCSDAFHYFLHRAASVRESLRILSADGVLAFSRFGNRDVEPLEGYELPPGGYERLFAGIPHVMLGEESMVGRYLQRMGPDLRADPSTANGHGEKWLSVIASRNLDKIRCDTRFDEWPHAIGRLQVNPIYSIRESGNGYDLEFCFPSGWYEFENARYREYAAERWHISSHDMKTLSQGDRPPQLGELIDSFVVLGMPDAYLQPRRASL